MQNIIFDTNAIIWAVLNKIDIYKELDRICDFRFKICVLDKTIAELKGMCNASGNKRLINKAGLQQKKGASLALKFIRLAGINIIKTKSACSVDDAIVKRGKKAIIVTQDKNLRKRLQGRKIVIRQRSYLAWSG